MPVSPVLNISGLNIYINPLLQPDGQLLRSVNMDSYPYGAKTKRSGYSTFLGTPDNSIINSLFSWTKNDGTTQYLYRASGSALYYSAQGTGVWTLAGNGTINNNAHVGYGILDNTMIVGDGVGSTRHTTTGTSFTNTSVAPIASDFVEYQNRIYAMGTSSTLFYSTTGDATNWSTSGTSDSSSLQIPGAGRLLKIFKASDKVVTTKSSGIMHKWDGFSLVDMATTQGPSSPYSVAKKEDYPIWLNRLGIYGYGGNKPQLLSNAIQGQIYNRFGNGIAGTVFNNAPAEMFRYDYMVSVGTVTEDITRETIPNAIIKYDYQKNEFLNYSFANKPTALHSYTDLNGNEQLIFGDSTGQVYKLDGTATTDNGVAIEATLEFLLHLGAPHIDKKWNWFNAYFNPGCQAQVKIAITDSFSKENLKWIDITGAKSGLADYRFPSDTRGRLLFVKITESSKLAPFTFYGFSVDAEKVGP